MPWLACLLQRAVRSLPPRSLRFVLRCVRAANYQREKSDCRGFLASPTFFGFFGGRLVRGPEGE